MNKNNLCYGCPRLCGADRSEEVNIGGYCKMPLQPKIAKACLHFWEEPCISGTRGSGTVFFSGCSLSCVFCQNYKLSHEGFGKTVSYKRLADIFRELEDDGPVCLGLRLFRDCRRRCIGVDTDVFCGIGGCRIRWW